MQIPSAGLCQEFCIGKLVNITLFIVQNGTCICPTDNPLDLHLNTNHCKIDCFNDMNSTHSYKSNSCWKPTGPKAYYVFLSQLIQGEDWATLNSVYCYKSKSTNDQLQGCKDVPIERVKIVEEERCESCNTAFNLLRKGNNSTAKRSKTNPLVFRRQTYISYDRESVTFSDFEKTNILSCQLCKNGGCTFTDCNIKADHTVCSNELFKCNLTFASTPTKTMLTTTATVGNYSKSLELSSLLSTSVIQKPNAATHTLGSFSQEQTSTQSLDEITEKSDTMKKYGIVATSFLICVILIGIIVFIIRKQIVSKRKQSSTLDARERGSNRKEQTRSDGVVVANSPKSCLYDFADNSKLEEETQYKQENEDVYHHLRESVPTNDANDDTYMVARYKTSREDNVYLGRMEDQYDHLIRRDRTRQENDTYDHAPMYM
ncbi:uncharacterized protein LOC128161627 [Crassostrea angulata]|uniref:uncharacterized protein LOC128161627 n=1 Tax=Magallana angulata TaxID=2784310 RepID=UPI0022B15085|nr:uncharacterized protein LOC128161627 [Crassostrea angulata]